MYIQSSAQIPNLLTERVLCAHRNGVFIFWTAQSRFAVIIMFFCAILNYKLQLIPLLKLIYLFGLNN